MATTIAENSVRSEFSYTIRLRWKTADEVDAAVEALPTMPLKNDRFDGQRTLTTVMHAHALVGLQARMACRSMIRKALGPELWYAAEIEREDVVAKTA
jgi:hypothetical protein